MEPKDIPGSEAEQGEEDLEPEDSLNSQSEGLEKEDLAEAEYKARVGKEVQEVSKELAGDTARFEGPGGANWKAATEIVNQVKPVPWLFWVIIRAVYGKSGQIGDPDPMVFSVVTNLMLKAASDKTLSKADEKQVKNLSEAVKILGADTAGSVCFIHAVCRRVSGSLAERIWRPLLDDALLRAHIGFHVGEVSPFLTGGIGMLAGFAGRCGLAVQIASGDLDQAQKALSGLASGVEISDVCQKVYKCDPLQVAALSLISAGCNRDIALGVAAYHNQQQELVPGSEQHTWLVAFRIIESLRSNRIDEVTESDWRMLGFDPERRERLLDRVQSVQRKGHGWRWMIKSLSAMGNKKAKDDGEQSPDEQGSEEPQ